MKSVLPKILAVFIFLFAGNINGFADDIYPKIVVEKYEKKAESKFNDGTPITNQKLDGAQPFLLWIDSGIPVFKVAVKDATGKYEPVARIKSDQTQYFAYLIKLYSVDNNIVSINIYKSETDFIVLTLNVQETSPGISMNCDCNDIYPPTNEKQNIKGKRKGNDFEEKPQYYDKKKIVYIYDFDPVSRGFYKVKKSKDTLSTTFANFNKEVLTSGKNVQFKVVNINKFMYNVSIADTVINYDSEPSILFKELFYGDSTGLLGKLLNLFTSSLGGAPNAITPKKNGAEEVKTALDNLIDKIECFIKMYNNLQAKILQAYDPCNSFPSCSKVNYEKLANYLLDIKVQSSILQTKFNELKDSLASNNKILADYKQARADTAKIGEDIKSEQKKEKPDKDKIETLKTSKEKLTADLKDSEKKEKELKKSNDDIEKALKPYAAFDRLQASLPSETELKRIVVFINNMVEQNQIHLVDYISLQGNRLDLDIRITTKDSIAKYFSIPEYKNNPLHIEIPIIWNPFVSFSAGSFIGIGKYMINKTYEWQPLPNSSNVVTGSPQYILSESGYSLPPMGFASLANGEVRVSRIVGLGISAGVGLTIESAPRLANLGGISILFGDLRQLAFTGGIAGMQVNKLKNNLQAVFDQHIVYSSSTIQNVEYYKEFKIGGFISLTYTPFKISKSNKPKNQKP